MTYKIINKLISPNMYSRPQYKIKKIKGIVIHWVANPKSTAIQNRNFFENRKNGKSGYGSAHEIIDLDGSRIICIPDNEMAYHVGSKIYSDEAKKRLSDYPNDCTYGIECTHIDWSGKMTRETYDSLVDRVAELCIKWNLNPYTDVWLHKEVVLWKACHKWFVDHPVEWTKFKELVSAKINELKGGERKLKLSEEWQWDMLADALKKLHDKGELNSIEWHEKAKQRNLNLDELTWLNTILISRDDN